MWLLVGLGNPGDEYRLTRHNVGFRVVDALAGLARLELGQTVSRARVGRGRLAGREVVLAQPQTYMNLSGQSVAGLMSWFRVDPEELLIIHDDLDLPLGRVKLAGSGSAGGHKGVTSIIQTLGREDFARLKLGISRPEAVEGPQGAPAGKREAVVDHVLSVFDPEEEPLVEAVVAEAREAVMMVLTQGLSKAQSRFNRRRARVSGD